MKSPRGFQRGARVLLVAAGTLLAAPVWAQIPDEFTNLKLLDPEITKPELMATMRDWTLSLGVRCNHCHEGPDDLRGMDFATDAKATKRTARRMLEMSRQINGELMRGLPVVDEGESPQAVSCYTCHRGQATPPRNLVDVLADAARESGPEDAVDRYRSMREEHYGAGRYDFREETLSRLSRSYAEEGEFDAALAVLEGAKEFFADSPSVYMNEGMIKFGARDLEGAKASFEAALALDPEFAPAKQALERITMMIEQASAETAEEE